MAEIRFHLFERNHIDAALKLWSGMDGIGLSASDTPERINNFLDANPGLSFVALAGETLAGALLCGQDGRRGYIHHLAVAPGLRNQGIGRQLVERALNGLRDLDILKCHLFVFQSNPDADLFWARLGWKRRDELYVYSQTL